MNPPSEPDNQAAFPGLGDEIGCEHFRAIADCTYDWESWHAPDGRVLWVNSAVQRMTGYRPDECLAMEDYPLPLVVAEDRQRVSEIMDQMRRGLSGNNAEFRVCHRDGSVCWMAVSWQPMIDVSGRALGFRASVRDVAEKRAMREQLRLHNEHLEQLVQERTVRLAELEKHRLKMEKLAALGELAAGVAHEINNPLAGIRNAFALIKRSLPKDVKHYDKLDLIDSEIERISSITHQMYQLYRPSQQRPSKFSLTRTIADVIALQQPIARNAKVKVTAEQGSQQASGDLQPDEVVLREGELKQVLFNLVRNAIQASSSGQQVKVVSSTAAEKVKIDVIDQGPGIADDVLPRIFDPFFSTKAEGIGHGMGLGLSVSRSVVEAMNGTLEGASLAGHGTQFTIVLPRRLNTSKRF